MNRPSTRTMVMGHPMIAVPVMLAGGVTLFAAFKASNLFLGLLAVAMLTTVRSASDQAAKYRAWKAEWDAMDPNAPRRPKRLLRGLGAAAVAIVLLAASRLDSHRVAYLAGYSLGWLGIHPAVLALPGLVGLAVLVRSIRRRPRRAPKPEAVKIVARTILPVPTLDAAYASLPDYCRQVLRR